MNKAQLIKKVSKNTGIDFCDVDAVLSRVLAEIYNATRKGENVNLRGFASFKVVSRKRRLARNIKAGESIVIPPKRSVKLVLGNRWKAQLNKQL